VIVSMVTVWPAAPAGTEPGPSPWETPGVQACFRSLTSGFPVLMGRESFRHLGRLLGPQPICIDPEATGGWSATLELGLASSDDEEVFICGDRELFPLALPFCQKVCLIGLQDSLPRAPELPPEFLPYQRELVSNSHPALSLSVFEKVAHLSQQTDREALCLKGEEALKRKLYFLARQCFEQALGLGYGAEAASNLALCRAKTGGELDLALDLARQALDSEPGNLRCHLNLGRLQILDGSWDAGIATLRQGVRQGGRDEFLAELNRHAPRSAPPIRSLSRNHPLNRYLGRLLRSRLGTLFKGTRAGCVLPESDGALRGGLHGKLP